MNHLKKENEKLRKLIIAYELKNKKNIYKLNNTKENNNMLLITKFNFKITKKSRESKEKRDTNKNILRDYKYNYSNKIIETAKKFKNITRIKKPEIKKIKDINLFDNDYSYMKGKEDLYKKYNNTQIYNNNSLKERNNSLSQRNRRLLNMSNNNTLNTSTMRVKNVIITKSINNIIFKPYQNLSSNRSHSKIIKKRKIYDNSFINNTYMKTVENRKNINSSLDKNRNSNTKQTHTQIVKKNKKKDNVREIYYQKPIINKITNYNYINNSTYQKQKLQLSEKAPKKQLFNRYDNNINIPFRI